MIISFGKKFLFGSKKYWEKRYLNGGTSGPGSYGKLAEFKAQTINSFIKSNNISNIIEFGCGDGNQVQMISVKNYLGFDVSHQAINICNIKFKNDESKIFRHINDYHLEKAQLTISLDVIFHLVEDHIYEKYMSLLFASSEKYVIIYSSNNNKIVSSVHVKHRKFTDWIDKNILGFKLYEIIYNKYPYNGDDKNSSFSNFYIYYKI